MKHNIFTVHITRVFSLFPPKLENMEVYAGATDETSVFDVDTSEPSSTSLPKSCMMHVRN